MQKYPETVHWIINSGGWVDKDPHFLIVYIDKSLPSNAQQHEQYKQKAHVGLKSSFNISVHLSHLSSLQSFTLPESYPLSRNYNFQDSKAKHNNRVNESYHHDYL